MARSRILLECLLLARRAAVATVLLGMAMASAARAQQRSFEELNRPGTEAERTAQRQFIGRLKEFARQQAPVDSPAYWAIINANIGRARAATGRGERSAAGVPEFPKPTDAERAPLDDRAADAVRAYVSRLEDGERIIGGKVAMPGEFIEVVSLARRNGNTFQSFCTGTLIAEGRLATVLTAAHCVCGAEWTNNTPPPGMAVVIGNDVNDPVNGIRAAFEVHSFGRMHGGDGDQDVCKIGIGGRDLAIVRFNPSAPIPGTGTYPAGLQPSRIATWQYLFSRDIKELELVGFGRTENKEKNPGQKRYAATPVAEGVCSGQSIQFKCVRGREAVAVDQVGQKDTCQGDSGGPAFIHTSSSYNVIAGVTSRGGECGTGGIYSLITPAAMSWLTEKMNVEPVICDAPASCLKRVE